MTALSPRHVPVLLREVVAALAPQDGAVFVDGTFGAGGYSTALLAAADCTVWGIDRDPDALAAADGLVRRFAGRLKLLAGRFGDMVALLRGAGVSGADGVTLDLGLSSMQLDEAERGFSFRQDGPLDMRMERRGASAADLVNQLDEAALADILHDLGEERRARGVARAIVAARRLAPITRTQQLADIVRRVLRPRRGDQIDPATRTLPRRCCGPADDSPWSPSIRWRTAGSSSSCGGAPAKRHARRATCRPSGSSARPASACRRATR